VVDDGVVEHGGQRLHVDAARGLPRGERVLLLVRPETVEVSAGNGAAPGTFAGEVVSQIFLGAVTRVRIEDGSGAHGMIADLGTARAAAFAVGTKVTASFPADSARLLSLAEQPEPASLAADPDDR
jgi:hypothetical protein